MQKKKQSFDIKPWMPLIYGLAIILVIVFFLTVGPQLGFNIQEVNIAGIKVVRSTETPAAASVQTETSLPPLTPIATDTATLSTGPLFIEDFHSGFGPAWIGNLDSWIVLNGKASAKNIHKGAAMFVGDPNWQDYTVVVTTTSSTGIETSYRAAIYIHYQDGNNFVRFTFNCDFPTSEMWWDYNLDGSNNVIAKKDNLYGCASDHYTIKAAVRGSEYKASIAGDELSFQLSNTLTNGNIGLYSIENGGSAAAAFSNLVVTP